MGLLSLLFTNPALFVILAFFLLYSIIAHEVSHGLVAYFFGDDTAMRYGRITLNPASHLDPVGTVMLFIVGFGWARPVPVDYSRLRGLGLFCVSLAGCAANLILAVLSIAILQVPAVASNPVLSGILPIVARINIILCAFNLIPIPPLDGSRIVMSFLPYEAQRRLAIVEPFGFFILILLLFTGLLEPVITFMQDAIVSLISLFFTRH